MFKMMWGGWKERTQRWQDIHWMEVPTRTGNQSEKSTQEHKSFENLKTKTKGKRNPSGPSEVRRPKQCLSVLHKVNPYGG